MRSDASFPRMGVSFGFGSACEKILHGLDFVKLDKFGQSGVILDHIPTEMEIDLINSSPLIGFVLVPTISPYSHRAIRLWDSDVPFISLSDLSEFRDGDTISVNFDSGEVALMAACIDAPINMDLSVQSLSLPKSFLVKVLSEVSNKRQYDLTKNEDARSLGVIKGELLLKEPTICANLASRFASSGVRPVIRFPDFFTFDERSQFFSLSDDAQFRGIQGRKSSSAVKAFGETLLKAGFLDPILVFPMISRANQISMVRDQLQELRIGIGASIETPAAALNFREISKLIEFVEFGVNDLSHYTLGCSRETIVEDLLPIDCIADEVLLLLSACMEICQSQGLAFTLGLDFRPSQKIMDQLVRCGASCVSSGPTLSQKWLKSLGLDVFSG